MEGDTDKAVGKETWSFTLWQQQLLTARKERYPFKEDLELYPSKWNTMGKGSQYLRKLASCALNDCYEELRLKSQNK